MSASERAAGRTPEACAASRAAAEAGQPERCSREHSPGCRTRHQQFRHLHVRAVMDRLRAQGLVDDGEGRPAFGRLLLDLVARKGEDAVAVYKRAGLDRRLFSKIVADGRYLPGKKTLIALALALRLDMNETDTMLGWAGYRLSSTLPADLIAGFFILNRIFDPILLDAVLVECGESPLHQLPRREKEPGTPSISLKKVQVRAEESGNDAVGTAAEHVGSTGSDNGEGDDPGVG